MELTTAALPERPPAMERARSIAGSERLKPKQTELSTVPATPIKMTGLRPIRSERDAQKYICNRHAHDVSSNKRSQKPQFAMRGIDCKEYLPSTIVQMRMRNLPCRSNSPHLLEQQCRDPRSSIQPQGQPHCSIVHSEFLAWLTYGNICIPRKVWPSSGERARELNAQSIRFISSPEKSLLALPVVPSPGLRVATEAGAWPCDVCVH